MTRHHTSKTDMLTGSHAAHQQAAHCRQVFINPTGQLTRFAGLRRTMLEFDRLREPQKGSQARPSDIGLVAILPSDRATVPEGVAVEHARHLQGIATRCGPDLESNFGYHKRGNGEVHYLSYGDSKLD